MRLVRENVTGVGMPGPYSSEGSVTDARVMAENLGIRFEIVSINETFQQFRSVLQPLFVDTDARSPRKIFSRDCAE